MNGYLTYQIGTTINIDGEDMVITKDNSVYFQRIVRMGLPLELALKGNAQSIINYFKVLRAREEEKRKEIVGEIPIPSPPAIPEQEFDLDGLSDDQKLAFKLMASQKGSVN